MVLSDSAHHDHGAYYGLPDAHRSTTMLIFLTDLVNSGGETNFPVLNLKVQPRLGDGLIWNNIADDSQRQQTVNGDIENYVLEDAMHGGLPPHNESVNVVKYAVNVWIRETVVGNINPEAFKTS